MTTIETPIMKKSKSLTNALASQAFSSKISLNNQKRDKATTVKVAPIKPKFPISVAIVSSFCYKGVPSSSSSVKVSLILP
jgi:hypothetical protein